MTEDRIVELEIKLAYQEELMESLNSIVAAQQIQIGKLEETCTLLHAKIESVSQQERGMPLLNHRHRIIDECP